MIVVDTNVIAYLLIEGDRTETARQIWQRDPDWYAPPLWRSEFLNVLAVSVRATVLSAVEAQRAWLFSLTLMGEREIDVAGSEVLEAAITYGLSAYDAQFVVAATNLRTHLITGDQRILKASPEDAISMEDFAAPR